MQVIFGFLLSRGVFVEYSSTVLRLVSLSTVSIYLVKDTLNIKEGVIYQSLSLEVFLNIFFGNK